MGMTRIEAVKHILRQLTPNELLIITTGFLSRDVYSLQDRPSNFYMTGSMGYALSIGIGLALNTNAPVTVISGDGAALMNLGSLVLSDYLKLKNLKHYVVDNGCYISTGGQRTCSKNFNFSQFFQTHHLKVSDDGKPSPRLSFDGKFIKKRFMDYIKNERRA